MKEDIGVCGTPHSNMTRASWALSTRLERPHTVVQIDSSYAQGEEMMRLLLKLEVDENLCQLILPTGSTRHFLSGARASPAAL